MINKVVKKNRKGGIYPTQISVEFDGFNFPSKRARLDYEGVDAGLREHGCLCYDFDGMVDFLYARSDRVNRELEENPQANKWSYNKQNKCMVKKISAL